MQEAKFFGGLLPSHPDYELVINAIRKKYDLIEIYPEDDPIKEIYLGDEIVTLEQFTQDIRKKILENIETLFPEDYVKKYRWSKKALEVDYQSELDKFSDELKPTMEMFFGITKNSAETVYKILDANIDVMTEMFCGHLLMGDMMEAPQNWFGNILTIKSGEETIIHAMISEVTNLDLIFQQIRTQYKKTFGSNPIRLTKKTANTAYFLQLERRHKDRDFIIDEFIRLNGFNLPKNKNSPRYTEIRNRYWQRLRKRLKKAEEIIQAIGQGKK